MIKKSMSQEHITILNMCVPNNRISQHEAEADSTARKNRRIHCFAGEVDTPLCRSAQIQPAENQLGHNWTQQHHQSAGCNWHLWRSPSNKNRNTFSSSHGTWITFGAIKKKKTLTQLRIIHLLSDHNRLELKPNNKKMAKFPKWLAHIWFQFHILGGPQW